MPKNGRPQVQIAPANGIARLAAAAGRRFPGLALQTSPAPSPQVLGVGAFRQPKQAPNISPNSRAERSRSSRIRRWELHRIEAGREPRWYNSFSEYCGPRNSGLRTPLATRNSRLRLRCRHYTCPERYRTDGWRVTLQPAPGRQGNVENSAILTPPHRHRQPPEPPRLICHLELNRCCGRFRPLHQLHVAERSSKWSAGKWNRTVTAPAWPGRGGMPAIHARGQPGEDMLFGQQAGLRLEELCSMGPGHAVLDPRAGRIRGTFEDRRTGRRPPQDGFVRRAHRLKGHNSG